MNISSLNPIGYEAQTQKGNTYKKSNAWTTGLVSSAVVLETLPYVIKNPVAKMIANGFSIGQMMPSVAERTAKMQLPAKFKTSLVAAGIAISIVSDFIAGRMIDKIINNKRAKAADKAAESAQND